MIKCINIYNALNSFWPIINAIECLVVIVIVGIIIRYFTKNAIL